MSFPKSFLGESVINVNLIYRCFVLDVVTSGGTATAVTDYVDGSGTITFAADDVTQKQTIMLEADTDLEGVESFNYVISVMDATTAMTAAVSANANTAKVLILDTSCKYKNMTICRDLIIYSR